MPVMVTFENVNESVFKVKAAFGDMSERTIAGMRDGIYELAAAVRYQAKGRGGLTRYSPPHPYGTKTPSPGDGQHPPARVTDRLLNSVEIKKDAYKRKGTFTIDVGSNLFYARVQEYGGMAQYGNQTVKLPPRPYMRPAFNRVMGGRTGMGAKIINRNVRRALDIRYRQA